MGSCSRTIWALPVLVLLSSSCARKEPLSETPEQTRRSSHALAPNVGRAHEIRVGYRPIEIPRAMKPRAEAGVQFEARNIGSGTWPSKGTLVFRFGYHWSDPEGTGSWTSIVWDDSHRADLPADVPPGGTVVINLNVRAIDRECEKCKLIIAPLLEGAAGGEWTIETETHYVATVDVS